MLPTFQDLSKHCNTPDQQFLAKLVELMQISLSVQKEILSELKQLNSSAAKPADLKPSCVSQSPAQQDEARPIEQFLHLSLTGN
jgi:hypothetical protein